MQATTGPAAPRRLEGRARWRADARPLGSTDSNLNAIAIGAMWCAAWMVLAIALVWPRTGFATAVAPWLMPLFVAGALACMDSHVVRGRRVYGPSRSAIGPLSAFTALAVATAISFGAPAHHVAWIAATCIVVVILLYVVVGALARAPLRMRLDARATAPRDGVFFVLVYLQFCVLVIRLIALVVVSV